ncbi:pyridoxamine 5'-phosphate oxidase family protein, partial [Saccharomonospora iraqiensis]|uniref:pyridoxamine 5'-phosphate oxidase family protein n=1 Tax=Saccharomonospora iraqiensis TaxID=52698 RepID=UPI0009FD5EED
MPHEPHTDARGTLTQTSRSRLTRNRNRAVTDRAALYALLDEALIGHLGVVRDGAPVVLPTGFARRGDTVYLHGSTGAGALRTAGGGADVCLTVSVLDGIVYARSLMHHSMNYRSAVVHGPARAVTDPGERWEALRVVAEHLSPGSWEHARRPDDRELAATLVLALDLTEASMKARASGPNEDAADLDAHDVWAGVLPVHTVFDAPTPAAHVPEGTPVPAHVAARIAGSGTTPDGAATAA